jgi:Glucodextranase, domain B
VARKTNSEFLISWMTISYRSIALTLMAVLIVAMAIVYFAFPDSVVVRAANSGLNAAFEKVGLSSATGGHGDAEGSQQAHFTNIDGSVKVKKANSNTWVAANYSVPLEKGDVVQTSSEGMAKIVFTDGTYYTIKQDSLIVVEENSTNEKQQTQVAVQVTTGTVDLTTGTFSQGSKSEVRVAGASASLAPESAAIVRNDPRSDDHEILLKKGSGQVTRGRETVSLSDWERVSFRGSDQPLTRVKEIGPPTLIQPANMSPVYISQGNRAIEFIWTPVPNTRGYRLRVSKNPYFSSTVFNRVIEGTTIRIPGLKEGGYYWVVTSMDEKGKESVESERNQFSVVAKASDVGTLPLELQPLIQHGHVIEVQGTTDPNARVMVNGQEVPLINPDGTFHFFTSPLPKGENVISVTAQNNRGAVKTAQKRLVIE